MPVTILRSIRIVSGELRINITMKDGESWKLIDSITMDKTGGIHANAPQHKIFMESREEQ